MKRRLMAGFAGISLIALPGASALANYEPIASKTQIITKPAAVVLGETRPVGIVEKLYSNSALRADIQDMQQQREFDVAIAYDNQLLSNTIAVETVVAQLLDRVGKTRYVFSGSTPAGWDCSGLVVWAYEQLGIELPHSASKQGKIGETVTEPKVGDVVLFAKGKNIYHAAIYVGDNKVVHSGFREGRKTEIIALDSPSFAGDKIIFKRLLDTTE